MSSNENKKSTGLGITILPLGIGIFGVFMAFIFMFTGDGRDYLPAFDMYRDSVTVLFLWVGLIMSGFGGWLISKKLKKQEKENKDSVDDTLDKF